MTDLYAQDGVNLEEGDSFSHFAGEAIRGTWNNSIYVKVHDHAATNFRGPRSLEFVNLPKGMRFDFGPDGIGTKVGIITEALCHVTAGHDLIAMGATDISRWGGLPVAFSNVLDVATLGEYGSDTNRRLRQLIGGLCDAADDNNIVLHRGETAELGPYVGSENPEATTKFNWAGFAVGVINPRAIITGNDIRPGHRVIALREDGFRSNGLSAVRKALALRYGKDNDGKWWENREAGPAISAAATPSVLYDRFLATMNGWYDPGFKPRYKIKAIVHVSGGGIPSKLGKDILFPLGLSATLYDLFSPPVIMQQCAEWRDMDGKSAYETWNGGQGLLVVVRKEDADSFIADAGAFGHHAKLCGMVLTTRKGRKPSLSIQSKFSPQKVTWEAA